MSQSSFPKEHRRTQKSMVTKWASTPLFVTMSCYGGQRKKSLSQTKRTKTRSNSLGNASESWSSRAFWVLTLSAML